MNKLLIPLGSITGDPIGVKRYMVVDEKQWTTAVTETVCLNQDGRIWKPQYQRQGKDGE